MDAKTKNTEWVSSIALKLSVEIKMLDEEDRKKVESIIDTMTNLTVPKDHINTS